MSDIVWIVGASTGIGRELALRLAKKGKTVVASARSADKLAELVKEDPEGRIHAYPLDATDEKAVQDTLDRIERDVGPISRLIYGAGFWKLTSLPNLDTKLFRDHLEVNFFAAVTVTLAAMARMRERGRGHIALISSVAGFRGIPGAAPYGSSKAALTHFAESIYTEAKQAGVKVQVIHPGFVDTPMTSDNPFPMPFIITAQDAARRIVDGLASDQFEIVFPKRMAFFMYRLRNMPYGLYLRLAEPPAQKKD